MPFRKPGTFLGEVKGPEEMESPVSPLQPKHPRENQHREAENVKLLCHVPY